MRQIIFVFLIAVTLRAQQPSSSAPGVIDSPKEVDKLKNSCFAVKGVLDCAEELFTGKPIHVAVGSIAPQNGFGGGLAYVGHKTIDNWRNSWNADAVGSPNGSWRAGFYMKFVHTPSSTITVDFGTPPPVKPNLTEMPEHTVLSMYAQTTSLNKLTFFGLGPFSTEAGRSFFGLRETIIGANAVKPFNAKLNASLFAELNGRFVSIRPSLGQASPSTNEIYTDATAPGLAKQPGTMQLGEGIRIRPVFAADVLHLNYAVSYQQFFAPADTNFSFQRLTVDLGHEVALYRNTIRGFDSRPSNGPDDCAIDPVTHPQCPNPYVRNFEGSLGLWFISALSMTPGGSIVPFYFQPTLGGADINGNPSLSSYQDYRFRAPNFVLIRESFEHSIWNLPVGVELMADEGKVALTRGSLGSGPWIHSFSTGLTFHMGGFPQAYVLFSWGGKEGTHTIANVNTSLLGAGARPALY